MIVQLDVSDEKACKKGIDAVVERFGRLDILVNSAGIVPPAMLITRKKTMDMDLFRSVIEINLFGTIYCSVHAAFHMSKNSEDVNGVIVNLSSVSGTEA